MVRQQFDVDGYWKVIVYYDLDYGLFHIVSDELKWIGFSDMDIKELYDEMRWGKAMAVTCSSYRQHVSIVLFNRHSSKEEYISSLVHEAEHVKQAMLKVYDVKDSGEPPAYTIGYLVKRMWEVTSRVLHNYCR